MEPGQVYIMPPQCWTVYIMHEPLTPTDAQALLYQLPEDALVVDYVHKLSWGRRFGLHPKQALEAGVGAQWRQVQQFLQSLKIDTSQLAADSPEHIDAMDDALDTLLTMSPKFLQVVNSFQRALELARPLRIPKATRLQYDALIILAHRVQALSPGAFTQRYLESYNEDDTFFLYDIARELRGGDVGVLYAQHLAAGRRHLAQAILTAGSPRHPDGQWLLPAAIP
jgi:hypothetical protein